MRTLYPLCFSAFALSASLLTAGPALDTSANRAATPLQPGLKRIGTLVPHSADEISGSNWTLGCEVLDRDFAIWDEYKDYIVPLGIKTIRLQGGWAKTEKEKGKLDFAWLDKIVQDALDRRLNILLETDYGNPVYKGGGGFDLGAGFPTSAEGLAAWDRWVEAMAKRYKGKVRDWAMWNEPDCGGKTAEMIGIFNVRTAKIIRSIIPDARIAGLSLASNNPKLLRGCLAQIQKEDALDWFSWFIYHGYSMNPDDSYRNVEAQKEVLRAFTLKARMRQGENGCPSETAHKFALSNHPWTEFSQAKWDLRRMLGDLGHDVESSIFTICDFNHKGREINHKGLLMAKEDRRVCKVKLAYYAVQNLVSVFDNTLERIANTPVSVIAKKSTAVFAYRKVKTGEPLIVFWENSDIPSDSFATSPAQMTVHGLAFKEPVWIDALSGGIYEIPPEKILRMAGFTLFRDLPVYDSPILIAEKSNVQN